MRAITSNKHVSSISNVKQVPKGVRGEGGREGREEGREGGREERSEGGRDREADNNNKYI